MSSTSVVVRYIADTRQFVAGTTAAATASTQLATASGAAAASTKKLGGAATAARAGMAGMAGPLLGAGGIVAGLSSAAAAASEFEASATKLVSQIGLSAAAADELAAASRRVGVETGIGAQQAVEASFFIASAGQRGAEAMNTLETSAQAARIGLGETAGIADLLTSAMNAYGSETLSAAAAADILTGAVREGKAEADQITAAMSQILPIAAEMGVSFNEVGAALASMTRTGSSASEAATNLRGILVGILRPSEQAAEAMEALGLPAERLRDIISDDPEMGLFNALQEITDAAGGNVEVLAELFPRVQGMTGVMDLMGSSAEATGATFSALADSTGLLEDGVAAVEGTTADATARMKANWEDLRLTIGDAVIPAITAAMEDLNNTFNEGIFGGRSGGGAGVFDQVRDMLTAPLNIDALRFWVDTFRDGKTAAEELRAALEQPFGIQDYEEDFLRMNGMLGGMGESASEAGAALAGVGGAAGVVAGGLDQAASAADRFASALEASMGSAIGFEQAQLNTVSAFDRLKESTDEHGAALDRNTQAGFANREAILGVAQAILGEVEARLAQGQSLGEVAVAYGVMEDALREAMVQAGMTDSQINEMLESIGMVPGEVPVDFQVNADEATSEVEAFIAATGRIPRFTHTTVNVSVNDAALRAVNRRIAESGGTIRARALGGSAEEGQPYLVGEQGRELFVPSQPGRIVNASDTTQAMKSSGDGMQPGDRIVVEIEGAPLTGVVKRQQAGSYARARALARAR